MYKPYGTRPNILSINLIPKCLWSPMCQITPLSHGFGLMSNYKFLVWEVPQYMQDVGESNLDSDDVLT